MSKGPRQITFTKLGAVRFKFIIKDRKVYFISTSAGYETKRIIPDLMIRKLHNWLGWYLAKK
jgi:hypothetical protein